MLVPFAVQIDDTEKDPKLPAKLRAELPGILNWALAGCAEWRTSGLRAPEEVRAAVSAYRSEMDLVGQWIEECCVRDAGKRLTASAAYANYRCWAERAGHRAMTKQRFGRQLSERGLARRHTEKGPVYEDIGLADSTAAFALSLSGAARPGT